LVNVRTRQCYDSPVRNPVGKLSAAVLLTVCIGVQLLEVSGRWDRTIRDANDEAGLVALILCVGLAVTTAGTLRSRIRLSRSVSHTVVVRVGWRPPDSIHVTTAISTAGPPLLRI